MKTMILALAILISSITFAQKAVNSSIEEVTVYKRQASISRSATTNLKQGKNEIVLTGISTQINPASLQVKFTGNNNILLAAKYERNYLIAQPENATITALKKQLEELDDSKRWNDVQLKSLAGMLAILDKNQDLGVNSASFTPAQVAALANNYKTKYLDIQKELFGLQKKAKTIDEKYQKINKQLQEVNGEYNRPSGSIVLKIDTQVAGNLNLTVKYLVNNAGWNPLYDLRSEGITKDVKLAYKANVYQYTGQDWNNVTMAISTGNPSQNNNRPILSPLYASIYNPVYYEMDKVAEVEAAPAASNMYSKRKKEVTQVAYEYKAQVVQNQLSVVFNLQDKQTVLSDGKDQALAIKQYQLKTTYSYHTVPKLDKGAFLIAKISDWSKYNLVAGNATIFFEGAYVGKTYINPQVTSDELLISMGRDNGIVVEREPIKAYKEAKFIGSNKKETIAYKIIIKNKKNTAIDIEILDQIPVSQDKAIEIVLEEKSGAAYTKENGKLLWTLNLQPRQSKEVTFRYTIKYPKKAQVQGKK